MLELLALLMGGTVAGTVTLNGPAPMEWLKRSSDPFCAQTRMRNEEVVGNLGNVLVHVVGAPAASPPPETHVIEQRDCMYRPRMSGMVFGQRVEIVNADPTLHNFHTYLGTQTRHCQAQLPGEHNFKQRPNVLVKLKCDVHQWMSGYVWIQDNSLFAVSGENGSFVIKNVPPGIWTVEAWHERFGALTATVLVLPWVAARVDFRY